MRRIEPATAGAAVALLLCLSTALAQPQGQVLWGHSGNDGIYSAASISDVNGDDVPDVAAVIYW